MKFFYPLRHAQGQAGRFAPSESSSIVGARTGELCDTVLHGKPQVGRRAGTGLDKHGRGTRTFTVEVKFVTTHVDQDPGGPGTFSRQRLRQLFVSITRRKQPDREDQRC